MKPTNQKIINSVSIMCAGIGFLGFMVAFSSLEGCGGPGELSGAVFWGRLVAGIAMVSLAGATAAYLNTDY